MKLTDRYSWMKKFRTVMEKVFFSLSLMLMITAVEAGTLKLDLIGCKAGSDNGYRVEVVPDIHPGHDDFNMYFCDYDAYTQGNLKQWAELDMVPHAIVFSNTTGADQNFTFAVGGDYKDANDPDIVGWDYITELTLDINATRILAVDDGLDPDTVEAACKAIGSIATQTLEITPDESKIFRVVEVENYTDGLTCVAVYNSRLAIGSSNYSGSSLRSLLLVSGDGINIGAQSLPLPDIMSTTLSKTMSAVQGGSRTWSVVKSSSLATVNFGDTCEENAVLQKDVNITVNWIKGEITPAGNVNVTTIISASNTASRDINISVTDRLYSGTTLLDTRTCSQATLLANTGNQAICSNTFTVIEGNAVDLNDIATATYTDPDAPGAAVLAEINATASAIVQGSEDNTDENATIKDREWISGNNLRYSVAGPGNGTFSNYTAGVETTDDVNWTSNLQTGSGSQTFTKTVYTDQGTKASGVLSDWATLKGSDGFGTDSGDPLVINLISSPLVRLTVTKTMDPADIPVDEILDFNFTIRNALGYENNITLSLSGANVGNSDTNSTTIYLDPGLYNVKELVRFGYAPEGNSTRIVDLNLPTCAATEVFTNVIADRPVAKVRKVTIPAGYEASWEMILYKLGEDDVTWVEQNRTVTTDGDWVVLAGKDSLQKGTYKIEETMQNGWFEFGRDRDCAFTYDPADGNRSDFECIYANARYAQITINKVVDGSSSKAFTFDQDINVSDPLTLNDGGTQTYINLIPGTYHVTETDPAVNDVESDHYLNGLECVETDGVANSVTDLNLQKATIQLEAGEAVECTFTNEERGKINVLKTENGGLTTRVWTFTLEGIEGIIERTTNAAGELNFEEIRLTAGRTYTLCEVDLQVGWNANWMLNGSSITPIIRAHEDHVDRCYDFSVNVGETAMFTVDNISPLDELARIGDFVWYDDNNNGVRDTTEEPVKGFTVALLDENGTVVATQLTDANGTYGFDVAPGRYSVRFSGLTSEYIFSTKQNDSIADGNGNTEQITLAAGESRLDHDAGIYCITNKSVSSSSGDAMGKLSAVLMILITLMTGLFFVRREEQFNRNQI